MVALVTVSTGLYAKAMHRVLLVMLLLLTAPLHGGRFSVHIGWALPGGVLGKQTKLGQVLELRVQKRTRWWTRGFSLYLSAFESLGSGRYRVRTGEFSPWVGFFPKGSGFSLRGGGAAGLMSRSFLGGREWGGLVSLFGSVGFIGRPLPPLGLSLEFSGRLYLSRTPLWALSWTTGVFVPWP